MHITKSFKYFQPETVKETADILHEYGDKAKILAGGVDLLPSMRRDLIRPDCVINIQKIPGLDYIVNDKQCLRIGALATLRSVELFGADVKDHIVLYEAINQIASVQVKTMGTLIGNICVASPASDVAVALLVLDAKLKIVKAQSENIVPIKDFFTGPKQTILQHGEIVVEILLSNQTPEGSGAFIKLLRTSPDIAKINVAVNLTVSGDTCKEAKIALGAVAPVPVRCEKAERILKEIKLEPKTIETAADIASKEIRPITDIRSTAEYRAEMARILVKRAILTALDRTAHGKRTSNGKKNI